MTDEAYMFQQDVLEKKQIARSARSRNRTGKGAMKTAMDFKTEGELKKMNGEIKTWRLNERLTWKQFKTMPKDIQQEYLDRLEEQYSPNNKDLAELLGVPYKTLMNHMYRFGLHVNSDKRRGTCAHKKAWREFLATGFNATEKNAPDPENAERPEKTEDQPKKAGEIKDELAASLPGVVLPPIPAQIEEAPTDIYADRMSFGVTCTAEELAGLLQKVCAPGGRYAFDISLTKKEACEN